MVGTESQPTKIRTRQDLEPLLAELRQNLAEANPNVDPAQLDALIEAIRQAAAQQR
jgi:hypothetical protein